VTIKGSTIEDNLSKAVAQTVTDGSAYENAALAGLQQVDQQVQQSQARSAHPPGQSSTPGRRPLFRTQ
jgi:hypothetical protein